MVEVEVGVGWRYRGAERRDKRSGWRERGSWEKERKRSLEALYFLTYISAAPSHL